MMPRFKNYVPAGVIPATLAAFNDDLSINERETRRHLAHCALTLGVTAATVNGHASEVHACSFEEQERILSFSLEEVGDKIPLICGVYADGSQDAAKIARMAYRAGASALLVFPSQVFSLGGQLRPEMALAHFRRIADATDLPIILFQYPAASAVNYTFDTLLKLFEEIPAIKAMKDWCNDPMLHERHIRTFQNLPRPVNVLTTHSSWMMSSLVMGAKGLLSGAGSVIADLQVVLFDAIQSNDLAAAKAINDRMVPMQQAFYAPPFLDMHNRMKEALVMLGRLEKAVVRPPLVKVSDVEITRLKAAIAQAGLRTEGAFSVAAE